MNEIQIYCWLMLDSISSSLHIFSLIVGCIVLSIVAFFKESNYDWEKDCPRSVGDGIKGVGKNLRFWLIILFISVLLPSSKQYALIKILPQIANSDTATELQQDVPEMYSMAKDYLKEILKEREKSNGTT